MYKHANIHAHSKCAQAHKSDWLIITAPYSPTDNATSEMFIGHIKSLAEILIWRPPLKTEIYFQSATPD